VTRYHHTKNKGDLGAIKAMADMTAKGWSVFVGLSEHQAFDFAAYRDGRFVRVQAKYRAVDSKGVLNVPFSTCWADRHGVHSVPIDRLAIDLFAIYCPDTEICYYVDPSLVEGGHIGLRVAPTRNSQAKRIKWANDFLEIPSTVRGVSAGEASGLVGWGWVRQSAHSRA
jgi:hypothetical protein